MDLEDDTTILTTLKSFNSFISQSEPPRGAILTAPPTLQSQYKRSFELLEAAEKVQSKTRFLQLDQEKKQMELSHKKARLELEKAASDSARDLEHEQGRNQELYARIKRLEESEAQAMERLKEQQETQRSLRKALDSLNKSLEEKEDKLSTANQTISSLQDEIRDLKLKLQSQDSTISTQGLEKEELQEKLLLQQRKYQDVSQLCQSLQAAQSTCSEHVLKIKELERRLVLQEQDMSIVKMVKSEAAKVPELEKELKRLREDNAFLRENRENCSLLKEEAEGLRRKLERAEKTREELLCLELDKEKLAAKLEAWENLGQSSGLNIKSPEDLFREVMQIQQREITLKEQNYMLNSRVRSMERSQSELQSEACQQRACTAEEQRRREAQDSLVRRLQKRLLLLTKERDGMRGILESYDSELGATEYSPQLNRRVKEAEDLLQKTQSHNTEMEAQLTKAQEECGFLRLQLHTVEQEAEELKRKQASAMDSVSAVSKEEVAILRQKIEDLEAERQRLEQLNGELEMRLEKHTLQGDFDPAKTRLLHFKMNPTAVAKQQRQQEVDSLQEEVTRLRELVRVVQESGAQDESSVLGLSLSLPPSKEVLELRKQKESSELKNQRLKEVFQKKIQEFRTVCYVLTGYQIDITTANQYRLTSVYAEHMDDSLLFKKGSSGSMQLMETEFSKTLGEMVSLHLHHQKSIPAFLSAVTLDLFSKQTVV
ncbi:mitotic spindle assembly checkpoint protein MAD1 [Periophthalmus magnuspinnatus]|uniref:mitotic spindle assembly checkpoint protein MAD1 n=1 Tax=Periophthalmus magnuspinnatus TaxID=409849 RepID=UPI00145BD72E|nr:mitotic spindle assembly checkpoint protein MAD1 [Periophthalmus magnuspinnatus]